MDEMELERKREVEELVKERIGLLDAEVDRKLNSQEAEKSSETTDDDCKAGAGDITVSRDSSSNQETETSLTMSPEENWQGHSGLEIAEFYGSKQEETSDNGKCDNQLEVPVPMEEEEEEGDEEKDNNELVDTNYLEKPAESKLKTSREDFDSQNGINQENSGLGRNKRVRQKNRYFADFHCSDVIKGARTSRDDYDSAISGSITSSGATRSSNRRTASSESKQADLAEPFETKYCRKCTVKTAHDINGCQACLYRKIIESSKRQKTSSQRIRSSNKSGSQSRNDLSNQQQSNQATTPTNPAPTGPRRKGAVKRRGRSNGCNSSISNNNSGTTSPDFNDKSSESNYLNNLELIQEIDNPNPSSLPVPSNCSNNEVNQPVVQCETVQQDDNSHTNEPTTIEQQDLTTKQDDVFSCDGSAGKSNDGSGSDYVPRLDTWTPDEVADYIASSGFMDEAQSFRLQDVDGVSLLLMQRSDFTYGLKIRLGPALKIYNQVCNLKKEYFRNLTSPI